jgi:hypothetical protein
MIGGDLRLARQLSVPAAAALPGLSAAETHGIG